MEARPLKWFQVVPSGSRTGSRNHFQGAVKWFPPNTTPVGGVREPLTGTTYGNRVTSVIGREPLTTGQRSDA